MAAETPSWLVFVGGLGLGSAISAIITALFQYALTRHERLSALRFTERKKAFSGLLVALADLDRCGEDVSSEMTIRYELAVARVQLVGSQNVRDLLHAWQDTGSGTPERLQKLEAMITEMRNDLGISD